MADLMLILGCALLAYGPFLSLFSLIVYHKAQLVIVVTTAAFFFLLASLCASLCWLVFKSMFGLGGFGLAAIVPGVIAQFTFRCFFVSLYHKIERVIQISLEKETKEELLRPNRNREDNNTCSTCDHDRTNETEEEEDTAAVAGGHRIEQRRTSNGRNSVSSRSDGSGNNQRLLSSRNNNNTSTLTETAKLRLQLNDASCGLAAGVGFGGMHAVLMYGTLLTSQTMNNRGVLYQESCPNIPSLVVSALYCLAFSILDVYWMLFTYFGMRRRELFLRTETDVVQVQAVGRWLGDSRRGGNIALLICLVTQSLVSLLTLTNYWTYGCRVSLPSVGAVVLVVAYLFWVGVGKIFLPPQATSGQFPSSVSHLIMSRSQGQRRPLPAID